MRVEFKTVAGEQSAILAAVHCVAFPGRGLTRLGRSAVHQFYGAVGKEGDTRILGAFLQGRLIGFCVFGLTLGCQRRFVIGNLAFLAGGIARRPWLVFVPIIWRQAWRCAKSIVFSATSRRLPAYRVMALAVVPEMRKTGVGTQLMAAAEAAARSDGYAEIGLSVASDNAEAMAFYTRRAWRVLSSSRDYVEMAKHVG